tara:strand:- start:524 stop:1594 length:1071 start_codon:yes stop_codon:yes gene_type:complete
MFKELNIKSKINGEYKVNFVTNVSNILNVFGNEKQYIFIIDEKVNDLYPNLFETINDNQKILISVSEQNKTIEYSQKIIRKLININFKKDNEIIAIGGGITQDLVAFISSILFRGIRWRFIPTTLLSQCDSCIGSKSSINFDSFKNLLGTFNPPYEIYLAPLFLETLKEGEIRSGIGEMLHYFFSEGYDLAENLINDLDSLLTERNNLVYYIHNSLRIKKRIIELDEFDSSVRHIFNYGHTFGHAIEALTKYKIPHGQAISIGMDLANFISFKKGILSKNDFNKMHYLLKKNILAFKINKSNIDLYCDFLSKDKKNKKNKLGCILASQPGNLKKYFLEIDDNFKQTLMEYSSKYGI